MAYRDENNALRAHLEAAEERLRETESALDEANHRADAAESRVETSKAADDAPFATHGFVRRFAVGWALVGIGFVAWKLFEDVNHHVGPVVAILAVGLLMFAAPSAIVLRLTAPRRRALQHRPKIRIGSRVRVAAAETRAEPTRVEEPIEPELPEAPRDYRRAKTP